MVPPLSLFRGQWIHKVVGMNRTYLSQTSLNKKDCIPGVRHRDSKMPPWLFMVHGHTVSDKIYNWHCVSYLLLSKNITIKVGAKDEALFGFTEQCNWFFCKVAISVGREVMSSEAQDPLMSSSRVLAAFGSCQGVRDRLRFLLATGHPADCSSPQAACNMASCFCRKLKFFAPKDWTVLAKMRRY